MTLKSFIDKQRVLDTYDVPGVKVFENFIIDFYKYEMYNRNEFYLYKTFPNGSDWGYEDGHGNRYMHPFNGYHCTVNVTNSKGDNLYSKTIQTLPITQPTWDTGGSFASFILDISSKPDAASSMFNDERPVLYLPELDVYTIDIDYGSVKKASFKRISGAILDRLQENDVIVIQGNTVEILMDFYQGPDVYDIKGRQRILYDIHPQQRHIIVLD